jgi:Flp pilus assembly protein TadD
MPRGRDGRLLNERPGSIVVDEAVQWIRVVSSRRFFAWIHLFEPHAPYEPDPSRLVPGMPRSAADRYDDEIARADREVGRLLEALGATLGSTLVVVAGDHGEAFGEHGEIGHSVFVYDTTLRVPLIFAGAGVARSTVVRDAVALVDVFPTVLDLLGLPAPEADGISLAGAIDGSPLAPRALFAESFAPLLDFGWSSLRAVRLGGRKYIAAPEAELYDVDSDPQELVSLIDEHTDQVWALARRVGSYSGPELPADAVAAGFDHVASARLQALGYVAGGRARGSTGRPDPKDRRDLAARIAQVTSGELQGEELRTALTSIVRDDPGNAQAHLRLGYVLLESGDCGGAEPHFRAAIAADLPSADPYLGLAQCLGARGDIARAAAALVDARRVEPGNPVVEANLGIAALAQGDSARAIEALTAALTIAPDLHEARFNLARAYARTGRRADAAREARTLLAELAASAPERAEVARLLHTVEGSR